MQLIDLNNLKIVDSADVEGCEILECEFVTNNLLAQPVATVAERLNGAIKKFLNHIEPVVDRNYYFRLIWTDESFSASDVQYAQELLAEFFASGLITGEKREREQRLALPSSLEDVNLSYVKVMRLVNEVTLVNCFGFEVVVCGYKKEGVING